MTRQDGPKGFEMKEAETPAEAGPLSFANLVLSFSASALVHLGVAPHPAQKGEQPGEPNIPMAQQAIEILEMLKAKMQGNLDPDEERLLAEVLHDLHLRFVKAKDASS